MGSTDILEYTQIGINVIVLLLFICIIIILVSLIKAGKLITEKIEDLNKNLKDYKEKLNPVIDKYNTFVDTANSIAKKIDYNMDVVNDSLKKLDGAVDDIVDFEKKVRTNIEPSVMDTITTFNGIVSGVKTFFDVYKKRKQNSEKNKYEVLDYSNDYTQSDEFKNEYNDIDKELNEVKKKLDEMRRD